MSDTSGGPGWWIASDGKWYPPETHPDYRSRAASQRASEAEQPVPTARPRPARPAQPQTPTEPEPAPASPGGGLAEAFRENRNLRVGTLVVGIVAVILIVNALASGGSSFSATGVRAGAPARLPSGLTVTTGHGTGFAPTTVKGGTTSFANVCTGKAAIVPPAVGQNIDFSQAAQNLQTAVDNAPSEIKADLMLLATPLISYFRILASANGNYVTAAQSPQFQALANQFDTADYKAAEQRVEAWFASHCS